MSQHNGASPLASIRTTPPSHITPITTTTSGSLPPDLSFEQPSTNIEQSSVELSSDPDLSSSAVSGRVQIPKLSPATTELLARVTGSIKEERQRGDDSLASWSPYQYHNSLSNWNTGEIDKMRASSAFIELPQGPFVYSNTTVSNISQHLSEPTQGSHLKPTGLINIAPKPMETPSALAPAPTHVLPPSQSMALEANATATADLAAKRQRAPAAPRQKRRSIAKGSKGSRKRKRGGDSDGEGVIRAGESSTDESDIAPTSIQTKSGRHVNRPSLYVPQAPSPVANRENARTLEASDNSPAQATTARKRKRTYRNKGKEVNIICIHCQRGHSPLTNAIVFCDECNRAWHQLCHDPRIDDEVVTVKEKEWLCRECKPVPQLATHPTVVRSNPSPSSQPLGPSGRAALEVPPMELGGEGVSTEERRGFLSGLSHATLVELLVSISDRHPSLPMFPENVRLLQPSKFSFHSNTAMALPTLPANSTSTPATDSPAPETTTSLTTIGETDTPNLGPSSSASSDQKNKKKKHRRHDSDDESEYEEFQEHRLYPRAGNGFRFSLNPDDLDIMRDDPACPTFSYALHGPAKARAEANVSAPVWGAA